MSKLKIYSIVASTVVLSYTAWASPVSIWSNNDGHEVVDLNAQNLKACSVTEHGQTCIPDEGPLMLNEYLACSSQAATQLLSQSRAIACMETYLAVKLSFISGVERSSFRHMPQEQQIEINRKAFEAYRNWNPYVVPRLEQ